jgi:hypothetical protein
VTLLLCGFGAYVFVLFIRLILPEVLKPSSFVKLFFALIGSFGVAWLSFPYHPHDLVIYGISGAGLGSFIHRLARLAVALADLVILRFHQERATGR